MASPRRRIASEIEFSAAAKIAQARRAAGVSRDGVTVELMPGLGLSRVQVVADVATLVFPNGKQQRIPVKCETRLDYAEPRELLLEHFS